MLPQQHSYGGFTYIGFKLFGLCSLPCAFTADILSNVSLRITLVSLDWPKDGDQFVTYIKQQALQLAQVNAAS